MALRNNISTAEFEVRQLVCRLLFNRATGDEIRAAVAERFPDAPKIHDTSLAAYRDGDPEYAQYCDYARQWSEKLTKRRWAASLLQAEAGAESIADVAEVAILEQLHDLAEGGLLETGKDVATVARAITSMQRTQLAREQEKKRDELAAIETEHEAAIGELQADAAAMAAEIDDLTAELDRLAELCERAGIDTSGSRKGTLSDAARQRIKQLYGIK